LAGTQRPEGSAPEPPALECLNAGSGQDGTRHSFDRTGLGRWLSVSPQLQKMS
jgi:hypothetical protein